MSADASGADDLANDSDGIGVIVGDVVGLELDVGTGENVGANDHGVHLHTAPCLSQLLQILMSHL